MKTKLRFLLLPLIFLPCGCETLTALQANPKVVFAETQALKLAQAFFSNGGNVDSAWGISQGINFIGDVASFAIAQHQAASVEALNAAAAAKLKTQVKAFASDPVAVNGLANGLAGVVVQSNPKNPEERSKVTLAIAEGIQKAAANVAL